MKNQTTPWTRFMDMHSGGGSKEKWSHIYIEAPEAEAQVIFYNRFGHNPDRVTCTCCGNDYSISEEADLAQATAFERGLDYAYINIETGEELSKDEAFIPGKGIKKGYEGKYIERESPSRFSFNPYKSLADYLKNEDVHVIYAKDIKPEERTGDIPEQGYVWVD